MGIDVHASSKSVFYSASNHRLIDSRSTNNPVVQSDFGFDVVSVFRRVKSRSEISDGNPLIYALKSTKGYSIDRANILAFAPEFRAVIMSVARNISVDLVVPVPSSSNISTRFAKRVACHVKAPVETGWLTKKYNRDVCQDLDALMRSGELSHQRRREVQSIRASLGRSLFSVFSMKSLDASVRHYFDPFKLARGAALPANGVILLVDDLLSTGASLASAKRILEARGLVVKCLCLFSSTGAYKPFP